MRYKFFCALAIVCLTPLVQPTGAQEKAATGRTLKVTLHYTGAGPVDDKHKIFVFIFDSPDFIQGGVMPIGFGSANSKDGVAVIADIGKSPIYISSVYDPSGGYDGQSGPPPSGSSLGLYSKTPGEPAPVAIEDGATAEIELSFDDMVKMP